LALVAMLGLALDGGNIYVNRRVAQTAADTGAMAAARALTLSTAATGETTQRQIGDAICTYVQTNNFGAYTGVAAAKYVGTDGAVLSGTNDVFVSGHGCPTPNPGTGHCITPPLVNCGVAASDVNSIPSAAAGVQVKATQTFSTYFMGIFGLGTFTVTAQATALVGVVTSAGLGSPFIVCGPTGRVDQDSQNINPSTNQRWDTLNNTGSGGVFNSGSVNLIQDAGNGGTPYDLVTTLWSASPAGPATTTAEINTLIPNTGHP